MWRVWNGLLILSGGAAAKGQSPSDLSMSPYHMLLEPFVVPILTFRISFLVVSNGLLLVEQEEVFPDIIIARGSIVSD